jgi:hypothetical protein
MVLDNRTFSWNAGLLKKDHMVFHRTNKSAGTYLFNLLLANGWKEIQEHEMDEFDHHFGVILDPYVRRSKAITERIYMSNQQSRIDDLGFLRLIEDACVLDEHMIPYSTQFKGIPRLTLFPLIKTHNIVTVITEFLAQYNITLLLKDIDVHESNSEKLIVNNKVYANLKWGVFEHVFKEDILLYEETLKNFINTYKK